jgi:hypothetical protein
LPAFTIGSVEAALPSDGFGRLGRQGHPNFREAGLRSFGNAKVHCLAISAGSVIIIHSISATSPLLDAYFIIFVRQIDVNGA